jgi:predicted nucleic acid-binding protein
MIGSSIVIDASLALRLVLPSPLLPQAQAVIDDLIHKGYTFTAPDLWAYEVTSGLCKAVHFGEITVEAANRSREHIAAMNIRLVPPDEPLNQLAFEWTLRLDRATAYDSYYLALAETLGCDFWTADQRLHRSAKASWLHLVA